MPDSGPPGTQVSITGSGWDPSYYSNGVQISFENNYGNGVLQRYAPDVVLKPDQSGNLKLSAQVPTTASAGDVITFDALIGNGGGARANFTVTPNVARQPGGTARCKVTFIGMHGVGETAAGSTSTSRTLNSALKEFRAKMKGAPFDVNLVAYPKFPYPNRWQDYSSFIRFWGVIENDRSPLSIGVDYLNRAAVAAANACHPARLVLVGYSEGAWIVDRWISGAEKAQVDQIVGVMTYGDPQWSWTGTGAGGIARNLDVANAVNPYRPPNPLGFKFGGFCASGDPVCGGGFKDLGDQLAALGKTGGLSPHGYYVNGATSRGAQALVDLVAASER